MKRYADFVAMMKEAKVGAGIKPLPAKARARVMRDYPDLPEDYLDFLTQVGCGSIGNSQYMVYGGPMTPSEIWDEAKAATLKDVVLVGDDLGFGFDGYQRWRSRWRYVFVASDGEMNAQSRGRSFERTMRRHLEIAIANARSRAGA